MIIDSLMAGTCMYLYNVDRRRGSDACIDACEWTKLECVKLVWMDQRLRKG